MTNQEKLHKARENQYFDIKAGCRKGLLVYLEKAIAVAQIAEHPHVLDVGCGLGVPTLLLAEKLGGKITAIDLDTRSLDYLWQHVLDLNLAERISVNNRSLFEINSDLTHFDLILAEGILNVVGFQQGFDKMLQLTKRGGAIIIHDELRDHSKKKELIEIYHCQMIDSFILDEQIWWNDYYGDLEKALLSIADHELRDFFKSEFLEIESYKKNPSQFKSIYYIIRRN